MNQFLAFNKTLVVIILGVVSFLLLQLPFLFDENSTSGLMFFLFFIVITSTFLILMYLVNYCLKKYGVKVTLVSLLTPFCFGFIWTYVVNPVLFFVYRDFDFVFRIGIDYSQIKDQILFSVFHVSILSLIGMIMLTAGFVIGKPFTFSVFKRFSHLKLNNKFFILLFFCISSFGVYLYVRQFGGLNLFLQNVMSIRTGQFEGDVSIPILRYAILALQLANYLILLHCLKKCESMKLVFILTMFTMACLILMGGRGILINHFLVIGFIYSQYKNIKFSQLFSFLLVSLFILIYFRKILFYLQGNDTSFVGNDVGIIEQLNSIFLKNYNYEQTLLIVGDFLNNVPLLLLSPLVDTITTFWPESIIPIGKYDEPKFTYLITDLLTNRNVEDTMTPGLIGLFYLMFRDVGIVIGFFIIGYFIKVSMFIRPFLIRNDLVLLLYSIFWVSFLSLSSSGSIEAAFKGYMIRVLPLFIFLPFFFFKFVWRRKF
ncbi:oligosaccharide repeat unit polymerase [Shewanella sp. MMG014]|uniref:O-antigen polymerase n=1 Tax=Shewanella sp. MMG014 TaxID=2822691 RepID=UPI001B3709C9|nr:O-antigen polymerase [Shewanella sp. MMG014]MBQ4888542.1 oligosaccharide repeat unit polymerase [Shewanella sp. MMG014]